MVKHIVMWGVAGASTSEREANARRVCASFVSLRGVIPGLQFLEVGMDQSKADYACDVVLYTEFVSPDALAAYASHPEHERVKRELQGIRTQRHQVDYTPSPQPTAP